MLCPVGELADDDGLASGCGVGLAGAELVGVAVGLADVPAFGVLDGVFDGVEDPVEDAIGVRLAHVLSADGRVGVGVLLGLEAAVASDVALPVGLGPPLLLGLTLGLGLTPPLGVALGLRLAGAVGLVGELGGGVGGVDRVDAAAGEDEVTEAADDC